MCLMFDLHKIKLLYGSKKNIWTINKKIWYFPSKLMIEIINKNIFYKAGKENILVNLYI